MRGKTDGRDASPTVRVRFRLPVGAGARTWRGVCCAGRRASGVGGRVTRLHGDVLRGIHQLALTKGACPRVGLFVCLFDRFLTPL